MELLVNWLLEFMLDALKGLAVALVTYGLERLISELLRSLRDKKIPILA